MLAILILLALGAGSGYDSPAPRTPHWSFQDWVLCILKDAGSPLSTLKVLTFNDRQIQTSPKEIEAAILAVLFTGITALVLWKLTVLGFRRMAKDGTKKRI